MAILVSAHNLKKTFGARPLFTDLTFVVNSGERIGLIGPNGAGKSTLLKIIAGEQSPDGGVLSLGRGLRVGYLAQNPVFKPGANILDTVLEGTGARDHSDWEQVSLAQELMSKLDLDDGHVETLSGGWKKRVALARELAKKPDLLLLDEPTNHLDVQSILWLEEYLANAQFATLTVTHDRLFLQRIASRILELDRRNPGGLLSVDGDYATYVQTKEALIASQERREIVLKNTLRRETEWLRRGAKARTTKQQARITRAEDLKDEVQELSGRNQHRTAQFGFQSAERNPKRLIDAQNISKSLGGKTLFANYSAMIGPGTRIGLLGPNGCGKSTLLRVLLGHEEPDTGTVFRADNLSIAYFEQNRDQLDPSVTVSETLCPRGDHVEYRGGRIHIRSYLDRFLFTQEQMDMKVGNLSGGEQSRLLVAQLMLQPANVLVLDEPTNDLDMATLGVLEECLTEFDGAVLLVTHDRYFLDQVATHIVAFDTEGGLVPLVGLEQWEAWQKERDLAARAKAKAATKLQAEKPTAAQQPIAKKKLSYKDQRELDMMEETIRKAEARLAELEAQSANPESQKNLSKLQEISKELTAAQNEVERLYARWAELESQL